MKKPAWLQTLLLSGLAVGLPKFAEAAYGHENPLMMAAGAGTVAMEVVGHFLIHQAHGQREEVKRREQAARNHQVRRGMAAALRRALSRVPKPQGDLYAALTKSWEQALKTAVENDDALERFFPAEQFAESHWTATNPYSPNPDQDSQALADVLREWLIPDPNLYQSWPKSEALEFAHRALPFYQQEFAVDLAEPDGLLSQAFTVKGINELRAFTLRALPLLQQIAAKQGDNHAEVMQALRDEFAEVKAALANPRVAPVKEPLINLPNTTKQILARDGEARQLLDALSPPGPGIVSISAPPGFGKSAVFALALRMALADGEPGQAGLNGIAVLDAKTTPPSIASFANLLGRMTGLQEIAARFASASDRPDGALRALFFDFLRQGGKVWLVVENAEAVLAGATADFQDLVKAWCQTGHEAKLLLLTRHAMHAVPECHRHLKDVEEALLGGLPEDSSVELLRLRLVDTRFRTTGESLLRQIARRLHRVPMALEQFAGYLHLNEQGVDLDQRFVDRTDLLRLGAPVEDLLLRMIGESLKGLAATSLELVRVVAWAGMPVPRSGLTGLQPDGAALLTRLTRSNLLLAREGTVAEGRSFDMHPLIREAAESFGAALDFERIAGVFNKTGSTEWEQNQLRPALSLFVLAERAARIAGKQVELARAIGNRGNALGDLGRAGEALSAYDESITIYSVLVDRKELRNHLAMAIMNRGTALQNLDRLEESVAAYDEAITIYRELVEDEHRQELRNDLAGAIMNRGVVLWNLSRFKEAVGAYDESIAIYREQVEDEHCQELRNDLAMAIMNRGVVLGNLRQLEEQVAAYDESITIYRELVEKEHRQELRSDLAMAIMNRGIGLAELGRLEAAVATYGESIVIYREMVETEGRQELRNDLAKVIMNRSNALQAVGRLEEAVAGYDESITIYRELVEKEHRTELRNDLARAWYNLAWACEKQMDLRAALEAAREARKLREDFVNEGMMYLEPDLARAKDLETRLAQLLQ